MTASTIDQPALPVPADPADPTLRGPEPGAGDGRWVSPALLLLLGLTAVLYLWDLGASGWANTFYSAAVQAGATSWKAFFFGSSDAASFITVDKPPASLWVMELSARVFGVNAWSMLVPQALEGVAAVGLLYATVRRVATPAAGLVAGAVLALTPVAALMFRFNNPDALLVLLLVAAAYATTRALERAGTWWLVLAASLVGLGFLTKMMQAFLVVPALGLVYLLAAPTSLRRRILQLLAAGAALLVSAGWWVAIVSLVPAADRPYIGGSQTNSVLELILGYNGFGRLTGNETGSVGGGGAAAAGGGTGMWGATGWTRLFGSDFGGQISWLIPAALVALGVLLWVTRRAPRTDGLRAAAVLWGGWLLVTGLTFSFAAGIIHPYYSVALAPAIGALVGLGATTLWRLRREAYARVLLAVGVLGTAAWAYVLLERSADWLPLLRVLVLVGGVVAAGAILMAGGLTRRVAAVVAAAALVVVLAGPAAYAVQTAWTPHTGAIPSAGPAVTGARGGPGGQGGPGGFGRQGGQGGPGGANGFGGAGTPPTGGGGGGAGSLLNGSTASAAMVTALQADASSYTWVAAAVGANTAAGYQLASGDPVMAVGGFNGTDPTPTLAQFQQYVAEGRIHYFIAGGGGGGMGQGSGGTSSQITQWVESTYTAMTVGGTTVYDLTGAS